MRDVSPGWRGRIINTQLLEERSREDCRMGDRKDAILTLFSSVHHVIGLRTSRKDAMESAFRSGISVVLISALRLPHCKLAMPPNYIDDNQ